MLWDAALIVKAWSCPKYIARGDLSNADARLLESVMIKVVPLDERLAVGMICNKFSITSDISIQIVNKPWF